MSCVKHAVVHAVYDDEDYTAERVLTAPTNIDSVQS